MVGGHQDGVANLGSMIYEWESNFITILNQLWFSFLICRN